MLHFEGSEKEKGGAQRRTLQVEAARQVRIGQKMNREFEELRLSMGVG